MCSKDCKQMLKTAYCLRRGARKGQAKTNNKFKKCIYPLSIIFTLIECSFAAFFELCLVNLILKRQLW